LPAIASIGVGNQTRHLNPATGDQTRALYGNRSANAATSASAAGAACATCCNIDAAISAWGAVAAIAPGASNSSEVVIRICYRHRDIATPRNAGGLHSDLSPIASVPTLSTDCACPAFNPWVGVTAAMSSIAAKGVYLHARQDNCTAIRGFDRHRAAVPAVASSASQIAAVPALTAIRADHLTGGHTCHGHRAARAPDKDVAGISAGCAA
jgi:hypothetical protein